MSAVPPTTVAPLSISVVPDVIFHESYSSEPAPVVVISNDWIFLSLIIVYAFPGSCPTPSIVTSNELSLYGLIRDPSSLISYIPVSYTHLTLPTILRV